MKEKTDSMAIPMPTRAGLIMLATVMGIALAVTIVTAQAPDFDASYKTAPLYVKPNDVMTYTIVAVNTGDVTEVDVVLSDTLPHGVTYVPGSCHYSDGTPLIRTCNPPGDPAGMWERDFAPGTRITTTFAVRVSADATAWWDLVNHASLYWDGGRHDMSTTTTVVSDIPNFETSYKAGTEIAERGDQIVYTIVAVNTGDPATDVTLTDPMPEGADLDACTYDIAGGTTDIPCNSPPHLWKSDLDAQGRITTTITATLVARTLRYPLQNCAYLGWQNMQQEICVTTLANPLAYIHLPLILRNWAAWYRFDIYEPNDTPSQAYGPLNSGQLYDQGYIWSEHDPEDYYYIIPTSNNTITIQLTNIPANTDYDLYVYHYDGNSYTKIEESSRSGTLDEEVQFAPTPGETYFIRIFPYKGWYSNQQPYHLEYTQAKYYTYKRKLLGH